jgi:hypothetical protein
MGDCVYRFFDFFDEIYCINLDKRVDRWNSAKEQFKKLGIVNKVKRFSAIECVDRETRNSIAKNYYKRPIKNRKLSRHKLPVCGAIGCATSHIEVIKKAKSNGSKNVFVFEDDFKIFDSFYEYEEKIILNLNKQKDWELFYAGWEYDGKLRDTKSCLSKLTRGYKKLGLRTTRAIAYNSCVYDKIIESNPFSWDEYGRGGHIDFYYRRNSFKRYFTRPALFGVHSGKIGEGNIGCGEERKEKNKNEG